MDQLFLDEMPDDSRHLVAVHFNDGVCDLDLLHDESVLRGQANVRGGRGAAPDPPNTWPS